MVFVQTAIIRKATETDKGTFVERAIHPFSGHYAAQCIVKQSENEYKALDAAIRYAEKHQEELKPGERFDIYYRCEEVKDERNDQKNVAAS